MATKNLTPAEKDEVAWHIEYVVRKLIEYVEALDEIPDASKWITRGHGATGQALLDASLMHLRALHEFLLPLPSQDEWAYGGLWVKNWNGIEFLEGEEYGRLTAKIAHLSRSRSKKPDYDPREIRPLATRCCNCVVEFLNQLPEPPPAAFLKVREHVTRFLAT
jgi:hypothetical protein